MNWILNVIAWLIAVAATLVFGAFAVIFFLVLTPIWLIILIEGVISWSYDRISL